MDQAAPPHEPALGTTLDINVAEVIDRIATDKSLAPNRQRDMVSALRTVVRLLKTDAALLSAEPSSLRKRLATVSPAAAGLTRGRWNNVRSLTLKALKHAGAQIMPGRSQEPLALGWEVLSARLPDAKFRHGLSRFMRFCSAHQISPDRVDATVFNRFQQALEQSLVREPRKVLRTACVLWNRAVGGIPGWPAFEAAVQNASRRYAFTLADFPASFQSDAHAYLERRANQDPFASDYTESARPSTIEQRRKQNLQIATALVLSGYSADKITGLSTLVIPENAERSLRFFLSRAGGKTTSIHDRAALLVAIAQHWVKAKDEQLSLLRGFRKGLAIKKKGMTLKNRTRLRQFDDAKNVDALLTLPSRVFEQVRRNDGGQRRDALRVMCAVAVHLLIVTTLRINNLTSLETQRHFIRTRLASDAVVHLVIPEDEIKNSEPYERALPEKTLEFLAEYVDTYRPRLSMTPSPWLFPNDEGERRVTTRFSTQIADFILKETGIKMNVHLFRHAAIKFYHQLHPEDVETMRRVLGHKSLTTTSRAYTELNDASAFQRYDELIESRTERSQKRPRQSGRVRDRVSPKKSGGDQHV